MERVATLKDARLKLKRAYDNLATLEENIAQFLDSKPYTVVREFEDDGAQHVYYLYLRREPPAYLGTIIGDVLHNLRSALDSIVWEFSKDKDTLTEGQRRSIQFPIAEDPAKYDEGPIRYVPDPIKAEIKAAQPCNFERPDLHFLAVINRHNLIDKHRNVPVVLAHIAGTSYAAPPPGVKFRERMRYGRFEDGAEIARFTFSEPQPMMDMQFKPFVDVQFDQLGNTAVDDLRFCIQSVEKDLLPRFRTFCAPGALRRPLPD
jgi:hypothetical protein